MIDQEEFGMTKKKSKKVLEKNQHDAQSEMVNRSYPEHENVEKCERPPESYKQHENVEKCEQSPKSYGQQSKNTDDSNSKSQTKSQRSRKDRKKKED